MSPKSIQFLPALFDAFFKLYKSVILSGFGITFIILIAFLLIVSIIKWRL